MENQNAPQNLDPKKMLAESYQTDNTKPARKKRKYWLYILALLTVAIVAELIYLFFIINY